MTIYLEYAIIDNLVINAMLLWFVFRTIKQRPPKLKIFLSALLGTGAALLMPLLSYTGVIAFFIKLFVGAAMVFIVQNRNFARFAVFYLLFFTYTFAFGGAIYGVLFMFNSTAESLLYFTYNTSVPVGVLILIGLGAAKSLSVCIKYLNLRHSVNNYLRDCVIQCRGDKFRVTSYLDTGNRLVDPETRAPVVSISLSLFLKMFPEVGIDRVFLNKLTQAGIEGGRYINFSTVDKKQSKMFTFAPQKFEVAQDKNQFKECDNVRLGVSMRGFRDAVKYDALLNASLA
jgi:stage II sporulation protein GA (sporulation sigma-E factor processing peptidase)